MSIACAALLAGCGKTGLAWVHEPERGRGFEPERRELPEEGPAEPKTSAVVPQDPTRPPLRRTVSLGETIDTREAAAPPPSAEQRTVVVQIGTPYPQVYGPVNDLGPIELVEPVLIDPDPIVVPPPPPAGVQPGRDWPAPPSFGPPFPFRNAPALPSEPAQ